MSTDEIAQADHEDRHPPAETVAHACSRCDDYEFDVEVGSDDYTCPICSQDSAVEVL